MGSGWRSFSQVTKGGGSPSATHVRVTLVPLSTDSVASGSSVTTGGATGRQRGREVWCYRETKREGGMVLQGDREEGRCGATGRQRGREVWCYRETERKGGVVLQGHREEGRCGATG